MLDLVLVLGLALAIGLLRAYVWACGRISEAGTTGTSARGTTDITGFAPVLLPTAVAAGDWISLVVALLLIGYLLAALIRPERF